MIWAPLPQGYGSGPQHFCYPSLPPPPWLQLLLAKPLVLQDPANVMQALRDGEQTTSLHPCAEMILTDYPPCNMRTRKSIDCEHFIFTDGYAKKRLLNKEGDCHHLDSWALVLGVQDQNTFSCQGLLSGKLEMTLLFTNVHGSMASEAAAILWALFSVISEPLLHGKLVDIFLDADALRQIMLCSTGGGSVSCIYSLIAGILDYARSVETIHLTHVFAHELQPWSETVD